MAQRRRTIASQNFDLNFDDLSTMFKKAFPVLYAIVCKLYKVATQAEKMRTSVESKTKGRKINPLFDPFSLALKHRQVPSLINRARQGRTMTLATPLLIGAAVGGIGWTLRTRDGWTEWWSGWALAAALCFLGESHYLYVDLSLFLEAREGMGTRRAKLVGKSTSTSLP